MVLEYVTIAAYLGLLMAVGLAFTRFTRNASDFIRAGGQATWWMTGTSILMASISAFTFTGNGSAAYSAGPTFLVIYLANLVAAAVGGLFLAAWFRQTRAHTPMDVVRARFGPKVEQFASVTNVLLQPFNAAIQLWALGLFASTAFNFPIEPTILVLGAIVVLYSTLGGKWAVMATDFVQGMVLFPVTILMAWLAWREVGGWDGFVTGFQRPDVASDYRWVKEPGQFPEDRFTWKWILVIFVMQLHAQLSIASAGRYLSTKDGREARRAAWLSGALMLVGTIVWFIPPMVARFLYSEEISALSGNQAESAYAFIALKLLPSGLVGVMIAAMFAATMSSMDTGLNEQAGIIVRNLAPRLRQSRGWPPLSHDKEILVCRATTLILGSIVISVSLLLSAQRDFPLFDAYLILGSTVAIPLGFPLLVGLWVRRLPSWAYAAICVACLLPSVFALYDQKINGVAWTVQDRALWIFTFGVAATLVSMAFASHAPAGHRERENTFFATMRRPVDFAAEIGAGTDRAQLLLLGNTVLATGGLLALLLLLPNAPSARGGILFVVGFTVAVGLALRSAARRTGPAKRTPDHPEP